MNRGKITITTEMLKKALSLPEDFVLTGMIHDFGSETFEIFGTTKEFDYCPEGACSPLYNIMYKTTTSEVMECVGVRRVNRQGVR